MSEPWTPIAAILALAALYVLIPVVADAYRRFRRLPGLWCPEAKVHAGVVLDAPRAALTSAFGPPDLRVKECSLWPERQGCGKGCLRAIKA